MSSTSTFYKASGIPGNDIGNATAETQFKTSSATQVSILLPADGQISNKRLRIHAGGRVSTTSNLTFTVSVYFGTSSTISANTLIYTTSGNTVNNLKTNWYLEGNGFWDTDSKTICGRFTGQIANSILGPSAFANIPSADPNLHNTSNSFQGTFYGLTITGQFSGSSTGNHAFLDVFEVELI